MLFFRPLWTPKSAWLRNILSLESWATPHDWTRMLHTVLTKAHFMSWPLLSIAIFKAKYLHAVNKSNNNVVWGLVSLSPCCGIVTPYPLILHRKRFCSYILISDGGRGRAAFIYTSTQTGTQHYRDVCSRDSHALREFVPSSVYRCYILMTDDHSCIAKYPS